MTSTRRPRLLVLELWGLGDLALATTLIRAAERDWEITLLAKPYAEPLLAPTFPGIRFLSYNAPWTAHRGKYQLHKWDWPALGRTLKTLRASQFDAAVSVRADPRDHLLMQLSGAKRRIGFPRSGSSVLLTDRVSQGLELQHKVEDWRALAAALGIENALTAEPFLDAARYAPSAEFAQLAANMKPVFCIHVGAGIKVRRWPEAHFRALIASLRARFDFHLVLVLDDDGYGESLAPLADTVVRNIALGELVHLLGQSSLVIGNDSGPAHIAAACGTPTIALFGPQLAVWFRPWGENNLAVTRDLCALRPCFDYCAFPEPYCLTRLTPDEVAPEIIAHVERHVLG